MTKKAACIERWLIALAVCLSTLLWSAAGLAEVTARTDRQQISVDDSFTLILSSTKMSIFDSPDLTALEKDFEILGTSRNSQHSIINGRTQSSMEWHISLAPKREGALVIPPIEIDGETTQALVVEVSASKISQQSGGFEPVFMQSEVDSESLYVQQQLILTVRIYYGVALSRGAQLSELEVPNAVVKQLNESAYETRLNNMNYNVHEVKYAIFPQRSGTLEIPALTFSANLSTGRRSGSLFDNFGSLSRGRPIRVRSEIHAVEVTPRAAQFSGQHWLPAEQVSIIENWSKDLDSIKVGEPLTRTLIVEARGQQASQLPPLNIGEIPGAQQYPDQAETADEDSSMGVTGTRIESEAIIATTGELRIPEVRLPWWNTQSNREEVAVIPARTLKVAGTPIPSTPATQSQVAPASKQSAQAPEQQAPLQNRIGVSSVWRTTTWLAVLLWLATLGYALWLRQSKGPISAPLVPGKPRASMKELEQACSGNQPSAIRAALINWARAHTGKPSLSSLASISAYFDDAALSASLKNLDEALYQPERAGNINGPEILAALKRAVEQGQQHRKPKRPVDLQPLYKA